MLEQLLVLLFSGGGALLVVADAERRKHGPWLTPDRPEHDEHASRKERE